MILEGGASWLVDGDEWERNPAMVVPRPWHDFVRLWAACRGESGVAHWPDPGGINDQAAWIVDAFAQIAGASARFDKRRPDGG